MFGLCSNKMKYVHVYSNVFKIKQDVEYNFKGVVVQFWAPECSGRWPYMGLGNDGIPSGEIGMTFQCNGVKERVQQFLCTISKICNLKSFNIGYAHLQYTKSQWHCVRVAKRYCLHVTILPTVYFLKQLVIMDDAMCDIVHFHACFF